MNLNVVAPIAVGTAVAVGTGIAYRAASMHDYQSRRDPDLSPTNRNSMFENAALLAGVGSVFSVLGGVSGLPINRTAGLIAGAGMAGVTAGVLGARLLGGMKENWTGETLPWLHPEWAQPASD